MKHKLCVAASLAGALLAGSGGAAGIRGRVLIDGAPAAGVGVSALPFEPTLDEARREARGTPAPAPLATTQTRADGSFVLEPADASRAATKGQPTRATPPAATPVRLLFAGGGAAPRRLDDVFGLDEAADLGEVELTRALALAGRVVDGRGGPVIGATVALGGAATATATTGADGTFRFSAAAERNNRLRVEAPGFAVMELTRVRAGALPRPLTLTLERRAEGRVLRADGRTPAAGALVRSEGRATSRWFETGPDGRFTVDGVPAEEGRLVARDAEGQATVTLPPAPSGGAAASLMLVLAPGGRLRGRVLDAVTRAPLPRRRVLARDRDTALATLTGPDGRYELSGLPVGVYALSVDDARYVRWRRDGVRVTRAAESVQDVLLVPAAELRGRVLDETGAPIEGAHGRLLPPDAADRRPSLGRAAAPDTEATFRSARDGSFALTRLPPGRRARLSVWHDEFEPRIVGGLRIEAGAAPTSLVVVLERGLTLRGALRDGERRPVAGAEVRLEPLPEGRQGRGGALPALGRFEGRDRHAPRQTGTDGRFAFGGLAPGDYALEVTHPGYARQTLAPVKVARQPPPEPLELVLEPGAAISGVVRDGRGAGVEGVRVSARRASDTAPLRLGSLSSREPSDAEGGFVIDGAVPGASYELLLAGAFPPAPSATGIIAPADGIELRVPGRGRIRGTVAEAESGRPVRDFDVSYQPTRQGGGRVVFRGGGANSAPGRRNQVHADDGRFVIEDVVAGTWDVEVRATGYPPARVAGVVVEEGADTPDVEVRLARGTALSGRVIEAAGGRPVADATVRAEVQGGDTRGLFRRFDGQAQTSSDSDGRFRLEGLEPGTWLVTAAHAEWSDTSRSVTLSDEGAEEVELRLARGGVLAGVVTSGGRPLGGADVTLAAAGEERTFGESSSDLSDDGGRFRFEHLAPGRYTLAAALRTRSSTPVEVVLAAGQSREDLRLELAAGASVSGHVTGLPESRLAGVRVAATGAEDYFASARTDAGGAFSLAGVPAGPLSLRATAGDPLTSMRSATAQVSVPATLGEVAAEIVFSGGLRLDGHVTRAGQPVAAASVTALPRSGPVSLATASTDENGAFALEGLREGTYDVSVRASLGGGSLRRALELTGDQTLDIEIPSARLDGTVLDADTRQPLADAEVSADTPERPRAAVSASDSNGHFTLQDLEPGAYRLTVTRPAYVSETRSLTLAESGNELRIELRRGEGLGLVARDAVFGTPLRGLLVHVLDAGGTPAYSGSVTLDSDGRGEVPSLRPGVYELRVTASGYAPLFVPGVAVPSAALSLGLSVGGVLEVHCGPQTLARPAARLRLVDASGRPLPPTIYSLSPDVPLGQPVRRLENLPPGRYTLVLDSGGEPGVVELRPGATSVVTLP